MFVASLLRLDKGKSMDNATDIRMAYVNDNFFKTLKIDLPAGPWPWQTRRARSKAFGWWSTNRP